MKTQSFLAAALIANTMLLGLVAARSTEERFDTITVREFRLVDEKDKERASIKVEDGGEVVFRLRDSGGTIRVKVGADLGGSGFVFLDDQTNPVIHGLAKKEGGKITVTDKDGNKHEY